MHACIAATFNSHQITWIKVFVIIFHCVCNVYMCALLIHSLYTKYPDSGFHHHSILLHLQSMHACIADTFNSHQFTWIWVFCHYIPLCLQCIHACIADTFTLLNTLIQGFHHQSLLHLQSMHACIADTFNSHQFTWIRVFVIIFRCVCNAYMHALLIHSLYTKYPDSGFLFWSCICIWYIQLETEFAIFRMHACVHCWYIHFTPNTLTIIVCYICHECITEHQLTCFCHYIPLCLQYTSCMCLQCIVICKACLHALLIHSLYNKYPDASGFLSLYPFVFAVHACMHCWYIQL